MERFKAKLAAIIAIIRADNYVVNTDTFGTGDVSPIYNDKFIEYLEADIEKLRLASYKHQQSMEKFANREIEER